MTQTDQLKKMLQDIEAPFAEESSAMKKHMLRANVHQALALSRIADAHEEDVKLEDILEENEEPKCDDVFHGELEMFGDESCDRCGKSLNL